VGCGAVANVLYSGDLLGGEGRIVLCDLGSAVPVPVDGTVGWEGTAGHRAMGTRESPLLHLDPSHLYLPSLTVT
jgi:hypothetical protein